MKSSLQEIVCNYFGNYCLQVLHSNKLLRANGVFIKSQNLAEELAHLFIITLNWITFTRCFLDRNYERENLRLAELMRKKKLLTHIQNSTGRPTYKSHSLPPPREADGREEGQSKSFEGKKKYCSFQLEQTQHLFHYCLFFFPFHDISRDIIGSGNSINEHSQPVH